MSLRARVAIAVGLVVFCALAIVAAVVYPAVGANLRGQQDQSLLQVAKNAPTIAVTLKQAGTVGQGRIYETTDQIRYSGMLTVVSEPAVTSRL